MTQGDNFKISDPELYARLSQHHKTEAEAMVALDTFLDRVRQLREECGIPELLLIAVAYREPTVDKPEAAVCQSLAMGDSNFRPELAASLFHANAVPLIERAARLMKSLTGET